MARIKPAYLLARQAQIAQAREDYLRTNPPSASTGAIESRGASTTLYYRSLALTDGTNPLIFDVNVFNDTLALIPAADLGLMETLGVGEISLRLRGSGVKPTRIHWFEGASTPVPSVTPWGSRVVRYYDNTGQSHFSAPFSERTGAFTASALRENFLELFGVGGPRRGLLGLKNGRAWMELERAPISVNT